ncbi:MAG: tRNA 2-thiouridine(34) synthase MnmA [Clostridiales bacterium]|nr:tRNA 2-thiouridine(34) synthase MnmA [Clostridiales bacterium]
MRRVLVAMSGGVDSAVTAALLQAQGYEVAGGTMLLRPGGEAEAADARDAAQRMGIPFHLFTWQDDFQREVIEPFQAVYQAGGTPNPCVFCNRAIKFGRFLRAALELGYDGIATGHYARIVQEGGRYLLQTGLDAAKDQAYMLYSLTQAQLARVLLPLGTMTKDQVRQKAQELGLIQAHKKDSQDICFIPDGDYMAYLTARGMAPTPGHFLGPDGEDLGPHLGAERYTMGQRRGLDIPYGARIYVVGRRGGDILLGPEQALYHRRVFLRDLNFIPFDRPDGPIRGEAVLRYSKRTAPCTLSLADGGAWLTFDAPQRAPTCGQSAVLYQGQTVVGGGIITQLGKDEGE